MKIRIYTDKDQSKEITDLEGWTRPKQPEKHWKAGRSAMELARYMTANLPTMPTQLEDLLAAKLNCGPETSFIGIPECVTDLPGRGEGRNHDMLLWADSEDIVIGLEAKVDESLGELISHMEFGSQNSKDRLTRMYNSIYGTNHDFETVSSKDLMYQLLSAAYGTLKEINDRKGEGDAVLLILTLQNGADLNDKMKATQQAIEDYRSQLKPFCQEDGSYQFSNYPNIKFWLEELHV